MALWNLVILLVILGPACAKPTNEALETKQVNIAATELEQNEDLRAEASNSYVRPYSSYAGYPSAGSYGVTGYGILNDKYNNYNSYYGGLGGYDNTYGSNGYNGYAGGGYPNYNGYAGNTGYGGYNDYNGYQRYGGYGASSYGGNGGYGGYGGNGGLISYYGYNSPTNQGAYHLGYGYYNKRPGSIYNSGVTPNLVTGYRGYSRR